MRVHPDEQEPLIVVYFSHVCEYQDLDERQDGLHLLVRQESKYKKVRREFAHLCIKL